MAKLWRLLILVSLLLVILPAATAAVPALSTPVDPSPAAAAPAGGPTQHYTYYMPFVSRDFWPVLRFKLGDSWPGYDQDVYSFTATAGSLLTFQVDTLSAASAFDIEACVSTVDDVSGCFIFGDDEMPCIYPPPQNACPKFQVALPFDDDGVYYLFVESGSGDENYAGPLGLYFARVDGRGTMSSFDLIHNNQPGTIEDQ